MEFLFPGVATKLKFSDLAPRPSVIYCISERLLTPTTQFSAKGVRDVSPNQNQVIIFPTVLENIGNSSNPGTGVFTTPANGTYLFSMQTCTHVQKYAYFQLVVDSINNVILVLRNYDQNEHTSTSGSVSRYLTEGQRVWVQSNRNSGTTQLYIMMTITAGTIFQASL